MAIRPWLLGFSRLLIAAMIASAVAGLLLLWLVVGAIWWDWDAVSAQVALVRDARWTGALVAKLLISGTLMLGSIILIGALLWMMLRAVRRGQPFHRQQGRRLRLMAAALLTVQMAGEYFHGASARLGGLGLPQDLDMGIEPTAMLAALLTLILAQLFDHANDLNDQVEHTV